MRMEDNATALERVYTARSGDELAAAYSDWSSEYDAETAALGYCLPFVIAAWLARYVPAGAGPILDAGCGTGLSGPYLRALGYQAIDGLDFSAEMLAHARRRGAYRDLVGAALGGPLPLPDDSYAAFFSTGVFTEGHAPANSLDELVRLVRPGGHAVFTVRDVVFETGGFASQIEALSAAGRWRRLETSAPFRAFAVGEPEVLVQAFVFQVT
ncbi:MAG: class I SAM-dependent methyltransferase [Rhizobiaceae bacterium]|nr:class I SAM-dependent methyltransferase [Rhizobiaceae bacterium]